MRAAVAAKDPAKLAGGAPSSLVPGAAVPGRKSIVASFRDRIETAAPSAATQKPPAADAVAVAVAKAGAPAAAAPLSAALAPARQRWPRGIANNGNTCFLSATLQGLAALQPFADWACAHGHFATLGGFPPGPCDPSMKTPAGESCVSCIVSDTVLQMVRPVQRERREHGGEEDYVLAARRAHRDGLVRKGALHDRAPREGHAQRVGRRRVDDEAVR